MSKIDNDGWILVNHKKTLRNQRKRMQTDLLPSETYDKMQQYPTLGHQDWETTTINHKEKYKKKLNIPRYSQVDSHLAKIDQETEILSHKKVNSDLSLRINNYRQDHHLTQDQLALKLNLRVDLVKNYENGTAIHDLTIVNKFNHLLSKN